MQMKNITHRMKANYKTVMVVLVALCLSLILYFGAIGKAHAIDLNQNGSLTVKLVGDEDLKEAEVVYDLYQLASLTGENENGKLTFQAEDAFASLASSIEKVSDMTNGDLEELSQSAAKMVVNEDGRALAYALGLKEDTISELSSGLYLLIARGSNLEDYALTLENAEGEEYLATTAFSDKREYRFLPQLVVLPAKNEEGDAWAYEVTLNLKSEYVERFGKLEIDKKLLTYVADEAADFVFQVDAYTDETKAKLVYSNVVSMNFTNAGEQSLLLEGVLPVGSYVEVTEVYSGTNYSLISQPLQTSLISQDEVAKVNFINDYNEEGKGGGSITNHFEYGQEGWAWSQE